jgi:hypothetical protein
MLSLLPSNLFVVHAKFMSRLLGLRDHIALF